MIRKKIPVNHICFDLDGTLVNSFRTILNSTLKTLEQLKIKNSISEKELKMRIGHHFSDIFKDLKIDVEDFEHFINIYKQNYFDFINQSELYPSVVETLSKLKEENFFISLLTTKGEEQAKKIIEHFSLEKYFDFIMGRRLNIPVKPNPEPLIMICKELNVKVEETLMVGDTELDINCGKRAGAFTCAVMFGYRDKEKLLAEKADCYIESFSELNFLLMKL